MRPVGRYVEPGLVEQPHEMSHLASPYARAIVNVIGASEKDVGTPLQMRECLPERFPEDRVNSLGALLFVKRMEASPKTVCVKIEGASRPARPHHLRHRRLSYALRQ